MRDDRPSRGLVPAEEDGTIANVTPATYRDLVRYFSRAFGGITDAEDLAQETLLRAHRADRRPAPDGFRPWLFTIARNVVRNRRRDLARGPTLVPEDDGPGTHGVDAVDLDLQAALLRLPELERHIFLLREVAGLSYAEIAETVDLTRDAVRSRLHRTRTLLRAILSADQGRTDEPAL